MVINSLAFNLMQALRWVLALPVCVWSKGPFPWQRMPSTHMFLESCSLCIPIRKQNYYSRFSHGGRGLQWYELHCQFSAGRSTASTISILVPPGKSFRESRNSVSH